MSELGDLPPNRIDDAIARSAIGAAPGEGLGRPRELRAASAAYNTFFQASRCVRVLGRFGMPAKLCRPARVAFQAALGATGAQ